MQLQVGPIHRFFTEVGLRPQALMHGWACGQVVGLLHEKHDCAFDDEVKGALLGLRVESKPKLVVFHLHIFDDLIEVALALLLEDDCEELELEQIRLLLGADLLIKLRLGSVEGCHKG